MCSSSPLPLRLGLTLCTCVCALSLLLAETRVIHVVQMLDDNSSEYLIREGCRSIDYGVQREVDRIGAELGVADVKYYRLSGSSFNRNALEFVVDYELAYQERDIIIMVYAGHGYREPGSTAQLPKLYFSGYNTALEGDELRLQLLEKNPSVLINLVIACNTTQTNQLVEPGRPADEGLSAGRLNAAPQSTNRAFLQLFAEAPGFTKVIDLVSADREFETFMSRDGGIFFSEVLYTFQELFADERFTDWTSICNHIEGQTVLRTAERGLRQRPICTYSVFDAIDGEMVVITEQDYPAGAENCRRAARQLRRSHKQELRALRHRHRTEWRAVEGGREDRKLAKARHREERARMRYVHLQNAQRADAACR